MCAAMGREDENKLAMATGPEQRLLSAVQVWSAVGRAPVQLRSADSWRRSGAGAVMAGAGTGMELIVGYQL